MNALDSHDPPNDGGSGPEESISNFTLMKTPLRVEHLRWSPSDAAEVRARLESFADTWEDPELDVYDDA